MKMSKTRYSFYSNQNFVFKYRLDGALTLTNISFLNANNNFNGIFNTSTFIFCAHVNIISAPEL